MRPVIWAVKQAVDRTNKEAQAVRLKAVEDVAISVAQQMQASQAAAVAKAETESAPELAELRVEVAALRAQLGGAAPSTAADESGVELMVSGIGADFATVEWALTGTVGEEYDAKSASDQVCR